MQKKIVGSCGSHSELEKSELSRVIFKMLNPYSILMHFLCLRSDER